MRKTIVTSLATAALVATVAAPVSNVLVQSGKENTVEAASAAVKQQYINKVSKIAQKEALAYGLYPSVMIAQALVEGDAGTSKLAAAPNNNHFGMKFKDGQDEGKYTYVSYWSYEYVNGAYVNQLSKFRTYPNIEASFADNGLKLRFGPWSSAPSYYSGTWLENAKSYKDSTAALAGKYANSPTYATTLNTAIATYGLTKYDPQYQTLNQAQSAKQSTSIYNTYSGQKKVTGTLSAGAVKTVLRQVTLPDGSKYNEIGTNQWVNASYMTSSATQPPKPTTPVEPTKPTTKNTVTVKYKPGYGIAVWSSPSGSQTGKILKHGTSWQVFSKTTSNGRTWYNVGGNQWIDSQYLLVSDNTNVPTVNTDKPSNPSNPGNTTGETAMSGVLTINYVPGYYVYLRDQNGNRQNQRVAHGSKWKVFAKKTINGKTYYKLGSNKQWIEGQYAQF